MGAHLFLISMGNKCGSVVVYGRTVALTPRAAVLFILYSHLSDWHGSCGAARSGYYGYVTKRRFQNVQKMKEFTIAIMDYSNASIKVFKRTLPSDIQSDDEELDKILTANGYKQSDCYFMLAEKINILNEV